MRAIESNSKETWEDAVIAETLRLGIRSISVRITKAMVRNLKTF
jgi:hypothetical protein